MTCRSAINSSLGRFAGQRRDAERRAADGWREHGCLFVRLDDGRLRPEERAWIEQLGERLYGPRPPVSQASRR